ncbi:MAG: hypothetical protein H7Y15_02895 [Pseudonocardia sp.]|nr:hypothetical protein [Pseudonocardia sp.]
MAPWSLSGAAGAGRLNDIVVGLVVIALSLPRGPVHDRYGGWDRLVR